MERPRILGHYMVSIWNKDFNPVLDANVRLSVWMRRREKSIGSPNATIRVRAIPEHKSYALNLLKEQIVIDK